MHGLLWGERTRAALPVLQYSPARMSEQKQHFIGRHLVNVRLTGEGSEKDTRHHEISLEGAPVTYAPGDALGLHPQNNPAISIECSPRLVRRAMSSSLGPMARPYRFTRHSSRLQPDDAEPAAVRVDGRRGPTTSAVHLDKANADISSVLNGWTSGARRPRSPRRTSDIRLDAGRTNSPRPCGRKIAARLYSIASSLDAHNDEVTRCRRPALSFEADPRGRVRRARDRWPIALASMYLQSQHCVQVNPRRRGRSGRHRLARSCVMKNASSPARRSKRLFSRERRRRLLLRRRTHALCRPGTCPRRRVLTRSTSEV